MNSHVPGSRQGWPTAVWRTLIGPPLRARDVSREQITPVEGLSALSLDALTSVAYGPEAILAVLAAAGAAALDLILPITVVIVGLLTILVFSYRQVIDAYPGGGGSYAVARQNFPRWVSLLAAASLVVDYTLTVAVSIAAGVASLVSAFPGLAGATVPICLGILAMVTLLNLRGLGDSARAFLLPTLVFIVGLLAIIAVGLIHPLAPHAPQPGRSLVPSAGLEAVGVLLVLKAFSAGCSALTGVEAIANGVPLFRRPRQARAKRTELLLGGLLGVMLLGLAVLADRWHVGPRSGQTALSQIMAMAVGRGWAYYLVTFAITVVLALAANTSFGSLPLLASLLARDNHLPHVFALRDDRQVFAPGIWVLAIGSAALLVAVGGNTLALIPLFAIGVFTGFTLSQAGLVVHWRRARPKRWRYRAALNGAGAVATAVATAVFLLTKFAEGAWVVVAAIPAFMLLFTRVNRYYRRAGEELGLGRVPGPPQPSRVLVVVPLAGVSRLARRAISEAISISQDVVAVSVIAGTTGPHSDRASRLREAWDRWDPGVPLHILQTEYASIAGPLVAFIDRLREQHDAQIIVLIPVVIPDRLRYRLLHNHLDAVLTTALRSRRDLIVIRVPLRISARRGRDRRPSDGYTAARQR
jgi:amino acid transporter